MPDPLINDDELLALDTSYDMGPVWIELEAAERRKIYNAVEGYWRSRAWRVDPFDDDALGEALEVALAAHLRDYASHGGVGPDATPQFTDDIFEQFFVDRRKPSGWNRAGPAETSTSMMETLTAQVRAIVEQLVPAWARRPNPPDSGTQLPAFAQADTRALLSRAGRLFWEAINQVPDTPGTATGVGSLLAVTGENDQDYNWRKPSQVISLSNAGGLAFDGRGQLHTSPSLVTVAARADNNASAIETATTATRAATTAADTALRLTRRLQPITSWERSNDARTVLLHWRPGVAVENNTEVIVTLGGVNATVRTTDAIAAGDEKGLVLAVPVTARDSASIKASSNVVTGFLEAQVTFNGVIDSCFIEVVDP